jgi:hypothetical protein
MSRWNWGPLTNRGDQLGDDLAPLYPQRNGCQAHCSGSVPSEHRRFRKPLTNTGRQRRSSAPVSGKSHRSTRHSDQNPAYGPTHAGTRVEEGDGASRRRPVRVSDSGLRVRPWGPFAPEPRGGPLAIHTCRRTLPAPPFPYPCRRRSCCPNRRVTSDAMPSAIS